MAPKTLKRRKSTPEVVPTISDGESYTDFLCPICLELLIEPVQLPCKHELCSACFEPHLENASLCCPMCRKRISTWVRDNRKKNTLVNQKRWSLIKDKFPERVQRRMEGLGDFDSSYDEFSAPLHVIAPDGEVRKEYEVEVQKIEQENADILQLNLEYIRKLEDEEFEEMRTQEEIDRVAAYALQKEEMNNLGVKLNSPTEHQRKLLELLRPKSPMKLRNHQVDSIHKHKEKRKMRRKSESKQSGKHVSPKCTITKYFTQTSALSRQSENKLSLLNQEYSLPDEMPCSSKMDITADYELATKLQSEFYSQFDESLTVKSSKRPLTVSNPAIT